MVKNRAKRARERAGLSVEQAAHLLDLPSFGVVSIEEHDPDFDKADHAKLADVYGVNVGWLRGDKERCDYASLKDVRGYDELSFHDREVVAEFAASLPETTTRICEHCGIRFVVAKDDVDTTKCKNHRRV